LGLGRGVGEGVGARIKREALFGVGGGAAAAAAAVEGGKTVQRNGFVGKDEAVTAATGTTASGAGAAGGTPKLFDFRTTDRPGTGGSGGGGGGTIAETSLLSRQFRSDGAGIPPPPPNLRTTSTSAVIPTLQANASRPMTSSSSSANVPPKPAVRPRAMSVTMRIKGEVTEGGEDVDPDEFGADGDVAMDEDGKSGTRIVKDVGKGSGGIKGKRKGMVFRCESCSKVGLMRFFVVWRSARLHAAISGRKMLMSGRR
jgi:hypothetical protein